MPSVLGVVGKGSPSCLGKKVLKIIKFGMCVIVYVVTEGVSEIQGVD